MSYPIKGWFSTNHFGSACAMLLLVLQCLPAVGQKNVIPATQSTLTGITLPNNTKLDKRVLIRAAAKTHMDMEAKDSGLLLGDMYEIYQLPLTPDHSSSDSVLTALESLGWQVQVNERNNKWGIAAKDRRRVMLYFEDARDLSWLYLAEITGSAAGTASPGMTDMPLQTNAPIPTATTKNNPSSMVPAGNYQFSTSHFDDGWVSTIHTDYVLVQKNEIRVYLFYGLPYDAAAFSGTGVRARDYYWDSYVASNFHTNSKLYRDGGEVVSSFQPDYVEGSGVDLVSGQKTYMAMRLNIAPNTAILTVATAPDEKALLAQFPNANDRYNSDLSAMSRYNKFAVAPSDLTGTWQSGGTQMTQWYNTVTGNDAGATSAASSATFHFYNNGTYTSTHNGATGVVGALNTFQQEYKGACTMNGNWEISLTKRFEGKTEIMLCHFEVIRGGRVLHLFNKNAVGVHYALGLVQ